MTVRSWSPSEVLALGARTDLATACAAVLGVKKSQAWELYHRDRLPFPTIRVGRRVVVPVAPLLALLHLTPDMSATGAPTPAVATDSPGRSHNDGLKVPPRRSVR